MGTTARHFLIADAGNDVRAELKEIKTKNLLISLEQNVYDQLLDTITNIWEFEYISDITKIDTLLVKYKDKIQNIGLIHHGNRYNHSGILSENEHKLIWNTKFIKNTKFVEIDNEVVKIIASNEDGNVSQDEYLKKFKEIFQKSFVYEEHYETYFILFFYMKKLLNSIVEGGNYLSIACNEADDEFFLDELSKITTQKIKLYANTNQTEMDIQSFRYSGKEIKNFGSILNIPLTRNVIDNRGWLCFNCTTKEKQVTGKDIVVNSIGKNPFQLIPLNNISSTKRDNRQRYYSKKFKNWYITNWGEKNYEIWRNSMKNYL